MKKIKLKTINFEIYDGKEKKETPFNYKENMLFIMRNTMETNQSLTYSDIETRLKIIESLENSKNNYFLLEDSEYDYLKKVILNQKWKIACKGIKEYVENVRNAENYEIK